MVCGAPHPIVESTHLMPHDGRVFVHSRLATRIDLCLFDTPAASVESHRIPLSRNADGLWTTDVVLPHGQLYALRADGPASPETGATFAPERLLLDPRARAIGRTPAPLDPLGVMVRDGFDWLGDAPPAVPWRDTVIYEAHVKGLTITRADVAPPIRGTFLGICAPPVVAHLKALGVTAIELLPIHAHADEDRLRALGLTNYWGYNSFSFMAPDPRFATAAARVDPIAAVRECQTMIRELHRAGIEVLLDVVYNHTAEGPLEGPTLSWRGLDPVHSYRRRHDDPRRYDDWTGCGNTLNIDEPGLRALVLDSLRYWVTDMHVDGFRFDLASAIDRAPLADGSLFQEIQRDPVLSRVKLIAEPWDATPQGYRLGGFPAGVAEWNGRYRDAVRRFWRGDNDAAGDYATRLCGSPDLFAGRARAPHDSLNFVTAHDGFTLADLVSFAEKHNAANGEGGADGESQNFSSNGGVEGATADASIMRLRRARQRAMLATLLLSRGIPMLSSGDEIGRTQEGNNNAYCHDSPLTWLHWPGDTALRDFVGRVAAVRRSHPCLSEDAWRTPADLTWWRPDGGAMTADDWHAARVLSARFDGTDDPRAWIWINRGEHSVTCAVNAAEPWRVAIDSSDALADGTDVGTSFVLAPVSIVVLTRPT